MEKENGTAQRQINPMTLMVTIDEQIIFCLLLTLPIACSAESISCKYSSAFIEETIPTDSNIQRFEWGKIARS